MIFWIHIDQLSTQTLCFEIVLSTEIQSHILVHLINLINWKQELIKVINHNGWNVTKINFVDWYSEINCYREIKLPLRFFYNPFLRIRRNKEHHYQGLRYIFKLRGAKFSNPYICTKIQEKFSSWWVQRRSPSKIEGCTCTLCLHPSNIGTD